MTHHVLIVDDTEENVVFMSEILEEHGYPYEVARNGKEALEAMKKSPPCLVLLDIMMPRKSGVSVLQEMKQDPDLAKVPVIVVTGASAATGVDVKSGTESPKETYGDDVARRFGADLRDKLGGLEPDAFLEKPIDPPVLAAKIKELLG